MIFIVIPVYNRINFTKKCLNSIKQQTYQNYRVVVIDDGSTDGTAALLAEEFPEVHVIQGNGKLWWTAATNLGVLYALEKQADYILTLNNDTIVPDDFLDKMMDWAVKTPNSLLGAFAWDADTQQPVYGGEIINWKWANSKQLLDILPKDQWQGLHEVTHFPGRGLLIPAEVFHRIGLFDQKHFPHYAADYDFTHRAIRAGFKVYCNYDAKLLIYPDASGNAENRKKKSLRNYYNHLFGIKGGGNIKIFSIYTIKNCPWYFLPFFLIYGYIRRIFGYWLK